ncbi:MAG: NAD-dependent epimerase/dehydratase family protein, partial [Clostridiales bacterium]|nr:NAD-dependent epimerase/dehydratase family protein [Clostridiales bacterium]
LLLELLKNGERVRILIRKDNPVFDGLDCEKCFGDVTDPDSLEKAFEGADVVYHLAGVIDINSDKEDIIHKINVDGTKNVFKACKKCGVRRLVYASSVDAFLPLPDGMIMREKDHFDPEPLDGTYAKTKAEATQYLLDNRFDGLEIVIVHPGACCGPYDFKNSSVGEMVRLFMKGSFPITLHFGAYDFVDVRDVAKGMYGAAVKGRDGECYILSGEVVTIDRLIRILSKKTGHNAPKIPVALSAAKLGAVLAEKYYKHSKKTPLFTRYSIRKLCSNCNFSYEKAEKELDYHPMSAEQSFGDMVDWIIENDAERVNKKK